jgi:hypothetical protein
MRYELRLTAFDMLDQVHIAAALYETPDDPERPTSRVWARTATSRSTGRSEAKEWIREVLRTTESALDDGNP